MNHPDLKTQATNLVKDALEEAKTLLAHSFDIPEDATVAYSQALATTAHALVTAAIGIMAHRQAAERQVVRRDNHPADREPSY